MGTTHDPRAATGRTLHRTLVPLLVALSLLASQLAGFGIAPAYALNVSNTLNQWANGAPGTDPASAGGWQNGNLNGNNSQYREGDSVAFRRLMDGFEAGRTYRVQINYDMVNNSLVAYDYLTSYDRTPGFGDPTQGNAFSGAPHDQLDIPADPRLAATPAFAGPLAGQGERQMSIWGGDLHFVGNYRYSSGTAAQPYSSSGTTTTSVDIVFTAGGPQVLLAWGGHIAVGAQWSHPTAPRNTNGSPYHMRNFGNVAELDAAADPTDPATWEPFADTSNVGNQDRSLKASAVLIPGLNLTKAVVERDSFPVNDDGQVVVAPGDSFTYSLVVTNDGEPGSSLTNVVVEDTIPSVFQVTGVSVSPVGAADCTASSGQDVACTIPTLAGGATVTVLVAVQVVVDPSDEATGCGLHENAATAANGDLSAEDSTIVEVAGCAPDLELVKSASETSVGPGDGFSYELVVSNAADATATAVDVVVEDTVRDELTIDAATFAGAGGAGTCTVTGQDVSCAVGDLAPGQSSTVTIDVTVAPFDVCGEPDNVATASAANHDPVDSNQVVIEIDGCNPLLSFSKTATPDAIPVGGSTSFTLTATNAAAATATARVSIVDVVPDVFGIDAVTHTTDGTEVAGFACGHAGQVVDCGEVDLAPGEALTVTIDVTADQLGLGDLGDDHTACGTVDNTGQLFLGDVELDGTADVVDLWDPTATVTVEGCQADVDLAKTVDGTSIAVDGGSVTYTLRVDNAADATATALGVEVTDSIHAAFAVVGVTHATTGTTDAGFACGAAGPDVSCGPVDLAPGEWLEVYIAVAAAGDVCGTFPNTFSVIWTDAGTGATGTATSDDDVDVAITGCAADVDLDKLVNGAEADTMVIDHAFGAFPLAYTITATASGEVDAESVVISDTVPAPLELTGTPTWSVDGGGSGDCTVLDGPDPARAFECALGSLSPGQTATVTVDVQVVAGSFDVCGPLTNTADVTWEYREFEGATPVAQSTTSNEAVLELVNCLPRMTFDKDVDVDTIDLTAAPGPGRQATYTLTAANGPVVFDHPVLGEIVLDATATAHGVTITDPLDGFDPAYFEVVSVSASPAVPCTADLTAGLTCGPADLAPGESLTVTLVIELLETGDSICGEVPNVATATWDQADPADSSVEPTSAGTLTDDASIEVVGCEPGIALTKTVVVAAGDDLVAGEVVLVDGEKLLLIDETVTGPFEITYRFEITNTGTVTLFDLALTDPLLGGPVDLPVDTLAPGASTVATMSYVLTDEDIAAGLIPNTATASGQDSNGTPVDDSDDEVVGIVEVLPLVFEPGVSVVKSAVGVDTDGDGNPVVELRAGETATITYSFLVTNTGDEDLVDLTLVDDRIGDLTAALTAALGAEFGTAMLPVGASVTVEADYTTTAADFAEGDVTNVVVVTGTGSQSDDTVSDTDTETVSIVEVLEVVRTLPRTGVSASMLLALGIVLAAIGAAVLLLTPQRRRQMVWRIR